MTVLTEAQPVPNKGFGKLLNRLGLHKHQEMQPQPKDLSPIQVFIHDQAIRVLKGIGVPDLPEPIKPMEKEQNSAGNNS